MKKRLSGILTLLLALVVQLTFAQQEMTVTGTVTDDTGLPLPGVNIIIQGTTTGVQTDFDGNYSIQASEGDVLVFSYLGLQTVEYVVGDVNTINIEMQPDAAQLDEVVITALGIRRKVDELTTANDVVDSEELTKANNPDIVRGLAGKVSGLNIKQLGSGVTGETRIVLRGSRSISGNNEALVVIDGAISSAEYLETLDPNSIESVNIMKGANGAALYGSQGSNGVIIVTTKRGTLEGGVAITAQSSLDFETVAFVPERQTRFGQGWDLGNGFENVIYENGGWGPEFDGRMVRVGLPQEDGSFIMAPYTSRGADHIKEFFQTGITQQNRVSISGGDDEGFIYLSAQNQKTEFVIENDQLNKSAFNFKAGKTMGDWVVNGNATYTYTATEESYISDTESLFGDLLQVASNIPIEQFEGSGNAGHWNAYYLNPYWIRENKRRNRDTNRFNLLADLQYNFNENINLIIRSNGLFTFRDVLQYGNGYSEPESVIATTGSDRSESAYYQRYTTKWQQYYTDALLNFDYEINDMFAFDANIGVNNQYLKTSETSVGGIGLTVPDIYSSQNLTGQFDPSRTYDDLSQERRYSVFGQVTLGFQDYLFLNATARNDWTSVLSEENNNFFYPSVGLSFVPTEAFIDLRGDVLNYAKLRASYVKVGNDPISAYSINQVVTQAPGFPFAGQNSFVLPTTITDENLEPEFTTSFETGVNLGFFNDRLTLDASYYNGTTDNQVTSIATSAASGGENATINVSQMDFWGAEVDLGLTPIRNEDFRWDINAGWSKSYAKVIEVSEQADQVFLAGVEGFAQVSAVEGEQFPTLLASAYERDDQGRIIVDEEGNPVETSGVEVMGSTTPDYIVNLTSSLSYKNFTLGITMDYRTGHVFYSDQKFGMTWSGHLVESAQAGRGPFIFPNSAIEVSEGVYETNTTVPSGGNTAGSIINFWGNLADIGETNVLDATALKIRELTLRYDVDRVWLENTFLTEFSISAVGRNLFTFLPEENRGYADPESNFTTGNGQGYSTTGQYPPTRTLGMGVTLKF